MRGGARARGGSCRLCSGPGRLRPVLAEVVDGLVPPREQAEEDASREADPRVKEEVRRPGEQLPRRDLRDREFFGACSRHLYRFYF